MGPLQLYTQEEVLHPDGTRHVADGNEGWAKNNNHGKTSRAGQVNILTDQY